jgi:hypothetical protein
LTCVRVQGFDAVTAIEVVEHLDPDVLAKFPQGSILGVFLLVTVVHFRFIYYFLWVYVRISAADLRL